MSREIFTIERSTDNGRTWTDAGYRAQLTAAEANKLVQAIRKMHTGGGLRFRVTRETVKP